MPSAIGAELEVQLLAPRGGLDWIASSPQLKDAGIGAVVRLPREARPESGGLIRGWVGEVDPDARRILIFTGDFGRLPISDGQRARYRLALESVKSAVAGLGSPSDAVHASEFKGMANRIIRRDQRDWLAVWDLFERPNVQTLRKAVSAAEQLRDALRAGSPPDGIDLELLDALAWRALANLDSGRISLERSRVGGSSTAPREGSPPKARRVQLEVDFEKTQVARDLHAKTLATLRSHLESLGYVVEENVHVDAYARLRAGPAIFEVKSLSDINQVDQIRSGLSQLYEYRYRYEPTASLWLVLSQSLSPDLSWMLDYLQDDRQVGVLWVTPDGGRIHGTWLGRLDETLLAAEERKDRAPSPGPVPGMAGGSATSRHGTRSRKTPE